MTSAVVLFGTEKSGLFSYTFCSHRHIYNFAYSNVNLETTVDTTDMLVVNAYSMIGIGENCAYSEKWATDFKSTIYENEEA
jgi:hypothetical protein